MGRLCSTAATCVSKRKFSLRAISNHVGNSAVVQRSQSDHIQNHWRTDLIASGFFPGGNSLSIRSRSNAQKRRSAPHQGQLEEDLLTAIACRKLLSREPYSASKVRKRTFWTGDSCVFFCGWGSGYFWLFRRLRNSRGRIRLRPRRNRIHLQFPHRRRIRLRRNPRPENRLL